MPDEDGQALRLELSTSVKDVPELVAFRDEAKDLRFKPGIGLAGVAWSHRAPQWWPDVTVEERFLRREAASAAGLRAALAVPIGSRDDVQAVVCCFFASKRRADDNALAVARAVAAQVRNVVARRRAEAQLELHAADLERSNLDLERFAYVASHDLQEPLRMVTSYLQLLQRRYGDALDSDAREFIQFAVDGSVRMQALIDGLLSYSRVGTARQAAEPVDLDAVARSVLDDLAVPIKEARATVDVGPLPIVPGSRVQLAQLLQNLIANGIKFSGDADPVVTVRATEDEQGWRFVVADNGIGIEPRHAERVFEVFQRLHGRGQYSGTGIGLAVARRVVERHNGRIWVESRPGEGAQFFFTLPRVT